jgi:cholinesterase
MRRSLLTLVTSLGLTNGQTAWKIGEAVKTTSGTFIGQASKWQPAVSEYLGIPFAKPPAGDLRWAAPQAITDDTKVFNATKYVRSNNYRSPEPVLIDILGLVRLP